MSNRPVRPVPMPNVAGGGQGGGAWVPGMSMPPLGFGVVPQQPGGGGGAVMMMPNAQVGTQQAPRVAWQQQQFVAAQQMAISSAAVGVQPLAQQHHLQQYQQHLQQQWQQKAAEEQRKLYEQMMKQRHYDEQKNRLKAFSSSKKAGVSADSMIENILGSSDGRKKSPEAPKKAYGAPEPPASGQTARPGTAIDWSRMANIDTLFIAPQNNSMSQSGIPGAGIGGPAGRTPQPAGLPQDTPSEANATENVPVVNASAVPPAEGGSAVGAGKNHKKPVPLPGWLSDKSTLPAVYRQAGSLVEGSNGWVDTGRAYMLLMNTGLPPPFLGVLWEMVNCTRPGQLLQQEFTALLALVALVQSGQQIANVEVLRTLKDPVLPIIDHPALLPLVQEYIQQRKQQQQQQQAQPEPDVESTTGTAAAAPPDDDEFDDFVSGPGQSAAVEAIQAAPVASIPSMCNATGQAERTESTGVPLPAAGATQGPRTLQPDQKPILSAADKIKRMNLPKVGFSPELSPSTSFDHTGDEEFDDFQSAPIPTAVSNSVHTTPVPSSTSSNLASVSSVETSQAPPVILKPQRPSDPADKYAVFRELEAPPASSSAPELPRPSLGTNVDESFGEFCSSEPVSLTAPQGTFPSVQPQPSVGGPGTENASPVSFEIYSTPPETLTEANVDGYFEADFGGAFTAASTTQVTDNYADIHEAMKRVEAEQKKSEISDWNDPFGEFEEAPNVRRNTTSTVPQLNVGEVGVDEEEDFGDFMGPEPFGLSVAQPFPSLAENLGETQSVASLELPGLEVTVGVQSSEIRGSGAGQSPDLFAQTRSDLGGVEDQLRGLSLESSTTYGDATPGGGGAALTSTGGGSSGQTTCGATSVMESFSGGLVDKYSIIREEASKNNTHDEAHIGSWQRCLEGSVKLLLQARDILASIAQPKLREQVLSTSQMQDYMANVQEVWYVCERISSSSQQVTTSVKVDDLLTEAKSLWHEISVVVEKNIAKADSPEGDNQMGEKEVCGVCLGGGGSKLTYGGHSYHPPCANLWLNCVDLLLPSLTPVTLL